MEKGTRGSLVPEEPRRCKKKRLSSWAVPCCHLFQLCPRAVQAVLSAHICSAALTSLGLLLLAFCFCSLWPRQSREVIQLKSNGFQAASRIPCTDLGPPTQAEGINALQQVQQRDTAMVKPGALVLSEEAGGPGLLHPGKKTASGGALQQLPSTYEEVIKKTEAGFSLWCTVKGQEIRSIS